MASRRQRFKAVVNLPIRRGRNDQPDIEASSLPDSSCHEKEGSREISLKQVSINCDNPEQSRKIELLKELKTESETSQDINLESIDSDSLTKKPSSPKPFSRKRLKPSVNLPAIIRKPKEISSVDVDVVGVQSNEINCNTSVSLSGISRLPNNNSVADSNESSLADNTRSSSKETDLVGESAESLYVEVPTDDPTLRTVISTRPKFVKPTPRLVDASSRHSSQTTCLDPDDIKKQPEFARPRLPSFKTAVTPDIFAARETLATNPLDDRLTTATAPTSSSDVTLSTLSEDALDLDAIQRDPKFEKRTTHRRIRKNGAVEMLTRARRDFQNKFGDKTPEKEKLRMFDFIFYNPSTNPMKLSEVIPVVKKDKTEDGIAERLAEESVDDLAEIGEEDDKPMPAPQVKVGPDGSLIIDEQSLVIETTGSRKRKDDMANSAVVVDYGLGNATYNSFSNKVKTRDWSKADTFKFYRALHSIGTDFLLMQSIFPNRTRKDLKQKFKKEDRLNRNLVDKALRNPLQFDLSKLEEDIAREENEEKARLVAEKTEKALAKSLAAADKKLRGRPISLLAQSNSEDGGTNYRRRQNRRRNFVKETSTVPSIDEVPNDLDSTREHKKLLPTKTKSKAKRLKKSKDYESNDESSTSCSSDEFDMYAENEQTPEKILDQGDSTEEAPSECSVSRKLELPRVLSTADDIDVSSTDDEEVFLKKTVQTRYGRIPLRRIRSNSSEDDDMMEEQQLIATNASGNSSETCSSPVPDASVSLAHPDLSNVEPGSLVILTTPGKKSFKLFMVGPKGNGSTENKISHIPVTITPEMFATLSANNLVAGNAVIPVNDCTEESLNRLETVDVPGTLEVDE